MALGLLKEDYTKAWHESFHWLPSSVRSDWVAFVHKSASFSGQISLGNRSVVGMKSEINVTKKLQVGSFTNLAGHFQLLQGMAHNTSYPSSFYLNNAMQLGLTRPDFLEPKNEVQIIGNDVWVAAKVTVLEDVNIADGCVIGTGSIVTNDTKPYGIYVGNPAKFIRFRFGEKHIEKLLELKWWDWTAERIARNKEFFDTNLASFDGNILDLIVE